MFICIKVSFFLLLSVLLSALTSLGLGQDVEATDRDRRFIAFSLLSILESGVLDVLFFRLGTVLLDEQLSEEAF